MEKVEKRKLWGDTFPAIRCKDNAKFLCGAGRACCCAGYKKGKKKHFAVNQSSTKWKHCSTHVGKGLKRPENAWNGRSCPEKDGK
jgi:hypothetical protein